MASREGSRKGLIVEVDLETGSTGQEGGHVFTRETEADGSGMRYRASGSMGTGTESIRLDSPDGTEGFVEIGVSH